MDDRRLYTYPWRVLRAMFKDIDKRMFLDILGHLAEVEPGTTLGVVEDAEEVDESTLFGDMSSHTYDVLRLALYSLGVLRPAKDETYGRDLDPHWIEVRPEMATGILSIVLAFESRDEDQPLFEIAPPELVKAFAEAKAARAGWDEPRDSGRHGAPLRTMTDAELVRTIAGEQDTDHWSPVFVTELLYRWLVGKGMTP